MTDPGAPVNPIENRFKTVTRYHIYFFTLYFITRIPLVWHLINFLFLAPPMHFNCNGTLDACPCEKPEWDTAVFSKTVQMKYGIYCYTEWLISASDTLQVLGILIGSVIFGPFSDSFGRLLSLAVSSAIVGTAGCLVTVMPNMVTFILMRMIEGAGLAGVITSSYVLVIEFCGIKYRETIGAALHFPVNLGHMAIAGVSYKLRDCDHFQLAVSIPMFVPCIFWFILLESPKWLIDKNHRERAIKNMEKFCKFNKGPSCETVRAEMETYQAPPKADQLKFHQLLRHKFMLRNLICMGYLSFICGFGYYGVTQFIGKMSGDIHLNTLIGGSFLVPGTILSVILLNKLNRKTFVMFACIASGVWILVVVAIPQSFKPHWLRILCAGLSNSAFYMLFIVVFLYCMELFPTSTRNSALGFVSVMSRFGQMLGPQINRFSLTVSGIAFGITALLGVVAILPMPETKGKELPSGVQDVAAAPKASQTSPPSSGAPSTQPLTN